MKYDFELDMNTENSLSIILKNIKTSSTILEFGPAMGRMTKYLKENLNCRVYIVEIDKEAFESASKFSEDGILGNVEDFKWLEKFKNIKFDYIIFADVLEHLVNPKQVFLRCKDILKIDGSIFISIPNIAHNSIIINLLYNRFEYTNVGILDDTHLRFFSYEELIKLIYSTGFVPINQNAVYSKVGENEIKSTYNDLEPQLRYYFKTREYGDLYQFVFELKGQEYVNKNRIRITKNLLPLGSNYKTKLYFDCGNGFNETQSIEYYITGKENTLDYIVPENIKTTKVRIDVINTAGIMQIDNIRLNNKKIETYITNSRYNEENLKLYDENPSIILELEKQNIKTISLNVEFIALDIGITRVENSILQKLTSLREENNIVKEINNKLNNEKEQLQQCNNKFGKEIDSLKISNADLIQQNENLKKINMELIQKSKNIIKRLYEKLKG